MKKLLQISIVFLLGFVFLTTKSQALAATCAASVTGVNVTLPEYPTTTEWTVSIDLSSNFDTNKDYSIDLEGNSGYNQANTRKFKITESINNECNADGCLSIKDGLVTWVIRSERALTQDAIQGSIDTKYLDLTWGYGTAQCDMGNLNFSDSENPGPGCKIQAYQNRDGKQCYVNNTGTSCIANNVPIVVQVSELKSITGQPWNGKIGLDVAQSGLWGEADSWYATAVNGTASITFTPQTSFQSADYEIKIEDREWTNEYFLNCKFSFSTQQGCAANQCSAESTIDTTAPAAVAQEAFSLCKQIPEEFAEQRSACEQCTGGTGEFEGNEGVWTAVGCIKRDPQSILQKFITVGLGMSGGVALLTFLAAGFIFSTSQGDPKAYGKAKEMMTGSIVGIIFVIFSVTILQFVGYSVLRIPGFGG